MLITIVGIHDYAAASQCRELGVETLTSISRHEEADDRSRVRRVSIRRVDRDSVLLRLVIGVCNRLIKAAGVDLPTADDRIITNKPPEHCQGYVIGLTAIACIAKTVDVPSPPLVVRVGQVFNQDLFQYSCVIIINELNVSICSRFKNFGGTFGGFGLYIHVCRHIVQFIGRFDCGLCDPRLHGLAQCQHVTRRIVQVHCQLKNRELRVKIVRLGNNSDLII